MNRRKLLAGLLVSVVLLLLHCADPRDKAAEAVLRADLRAMRDVVQQFRGDQGGYPASLEELVEEGYLRSIPVDPITKSTETWIEVRDASEPDSGVRGVRSGAEGQATDGTRYSDW